MHDFLYCSLIALAICTTIFSFVEGLASYINNRLMSPIYIYTGSIVWAILIVYWWN